MVPLIWFQALLVIATAMTCVGLCVRLFKWSRTPKLCGTCRFHADGACRRWPPRRVYTLPDGKVDVTVWPVVRTEQDWCGEHTRS